MGKKNRRARTGRGGRNFAVHLDPVARRRLELQLGTDLDAPAGLDIVDEEGAVRRRAGGAVGRADAAIRTVGGATRLQTPEGVVGVQRGLFKIVEEVLVQEGAEVDEIEEQLELERLVDRDFLRQ